jgi:putative SOS response-associated peptidase YedK
MPVILKPEDYDAWLDPGLHDAEALRQLLRPYPVEAMMAYPVSTPPKHEGQECIMPADPENRLSGSSKLTVPCIAKGLGVPRSA